MCFKTQEPNDLLNIVMIGISDDASKTHSFMKKMIGLIKHNQ